MPLLIPLDPAVEARSGEIRVVAMSAARTEHGTVATVAVWNGAPLGVEEVTLTNGDDRDRLVRKITQVAGDQYGSDLSRCLLDVYPDVESGMRRGEARTITSDDDEVQIAPWPTPLSKAAYIGLPKDMVDAILPHTEGDPAAILMSFLAIAGAYLGHLPHWRASGSRHGLSEYVLIVGKSSTGRKGSSISHVREFFWKLDPEWGTGTRRRMKSGLSSGEGLIADLAKAGAPDPDDKTHPATTDPDVLLQEQRSVYIESEFASVLRRMAQEGNSLSMVLRQAWDGEQLGTITKKDPTQTGGAHISIVGTISKIDALRFLKESEMRNGFANRFLWCATKPSKSLPRGGGMPDFTDQMIYMMRQRTHALAIGRTLEVPMTSAADALWLERYDGMNNRPEGVVGDMTSRAAPHTLRLAMLYSFLTDESGVIDRHHLEAALEVWRYSEDSVRWLFGQGTDSSDALRILAALQAAYPDHLSRSTIVDLFARNASKARIDAAIEALMESHPIERTVFPRGDGRPGKGTTAYRLRTRP